jgi:hypothetical protein
LNIDYYRLALCATEEAAQKLNSEIAFLKAVKSGLVKLVTTDFEINWFISASTSAGVFLRLLPSLGGANNLTSPDFTAFKNAISLFSFWAASSVAPSEGSNRKKTPAEVEAEINQLISKSVVTEEVVDWS